MSADRLRLRMTFDDAPAEYDRLRPVCPPELFDDLAALAGWRAGAGLVEIGCGTGQATLPLAERGFALVGVEIGKQLADWTRRKLAAFPKVDIIHADFDEWDPADASFDGVVAVNAFHWLDPKLRYAKVARLLRDAGILAVVASHYVHPDNADSFWVEVQEDYNALRNSPEQQPPPHPEAISDLSAEIGASGYFRNTGSRRYMWNTRYTADEYVALLGTTSWHCQLDAEDRQQLFERIRRRIEALPDRTVRPTLLATLNVARRL